MEGGPWAGGGPVPSDVDPHAAPHPPAHRGVGMRGLSPLPLSPSPAAHTGVGRSRGMGSGKIRPISCRVAGRGEGHVIEFGIHLTPGAIFHKRWLECFPFGI